MSVTIGPWEGEQPPTEQAIRSLLSTEGLEPYRWSNGPDDVYAAHFHSYHKVIYVVTGSITFGLPDTGEEVLLKSGDRLELPRETMHDAVVGRQGVVCLEAHRY